MTLEQKLEIAHKEIENLEKVIEQKNIANKKLQDTIAQQELRFESLRDPTGLQSFKRLLNSFTSGIDSIYAEKEQQYSTMKAVCRMMEDMKEKKDGEEEAETLRIAKQQTAIEQLIEEKEILEMQLGVEKNKFKPVTRRIVNATREEAKELRKQMTTRIMDSK